MSDLIEGYQQFLGDLKQRIRSAQYAALKSVNRELLTLYWDIGRMIIDRQRGETWGNAVVEQLAADLRREFPGIGGFSARNIWRMREFYLTYRDNEKLTQLVTEIGWSHNLRIMSKCKDPLEREFYIRMSRKYGWSRQVLENHIDNQTYEKTLLNQTNFATTVTEASRDQAILSIRDEYTFDFLDLGQDYNERQLEQAIIARVDLFLREMGGMFAYVGSQYRLEVSDQEFFIDLLLFHRRLKCLIAVDLKVGRFMPEYVGKMQFYLAVLDEQVRMEGENPSIGIILCKSKDKTIVEYALKDATKPIGVATYRTFSSLPQELQGELPGPDQVAKLLEGIE